jgi:methyl-accepting chemotaxis protein
MSEINNASHEQSRRAEEVTHAIAQIDQSTQGNVDMVSQAGNSTELLRGEARAMTASIAEFTHEQPFAVAPAMSAPSDDTDAVRRVQAA